MPRVETTLWIQAPVEKVYQIARNNEDFPNFMDDVSSLTIVEQDGLRVVSDWVGVIPTFGLKVKWRQEDVWDESAHRCEFRQLSGDYDAMSGTWQLSEEDGGTRFDSVLDYEYKVPGIGPLVTKVVHNLVVKNLAGVLQALKERAEAS
ncbi:MAG: SRPBCC family protein [Fimbriimonadaceae bacterium]|nr:SRPBCC family protein [Fimbriimonadaceae bacterium]